MPDKSSLVDLIADDDAWQCKETLRRKFDKAVHEARDEGWQPEQVAAAVEELADDYMEFLVAQVWRQLSPGYLN